MPRPDDAAERALSVREGHPSPFAQAASSNAQDDSVQQRSRRGGWSSATGSGRRCEGSTSSAAPGSCGGDRPQRSREDDAALDPRRDTPAPTAGEVECGGEVGWVPPQAAVYRRLTAEENLLLFARLEKHEDPHASVEEMLELTGLAERRGEIVARLSGGNQQRINIAIGLLARPAVLLLDEPSVGLDPRQRARLWEFVSALAERRDDGDLLDPRHPGGRALRRAAARARRRRGAIRRLADGLREVVRSEAPEAAERDFETAFVAFLHHRGHLMRWLLLKDLQILRRSPLQASCSSPSRC